ncbi:MAG: HD domain-containing phosphohydrolase [Chloroflexota bacterium]
MNEQVLFVDDDSNLLAALKRLLRKQFELSLAQGGEEGLELLERAGPFAVVVADMRMPGMDGVEFLSLVKERSPETVRMMLTGNADLQTAINAVNEGNIFRFLTKPCPMETIAATLTAGLEQYRLINAERELLEKTLRGSIKVLTDILGLVNPIAFSRANSIRRYVRHITIQLRLPQPWQYEIAALLSQIGCVTLPPDTLDKIYAQAPLSDEEKHMFTAHPTVGYNLLANIPRLELIAQMIGQQQKSFRAFPSLNDLTDEERTVTLGAQILKVALDLDQMVVHGTPFKEALTLLRIQPREYNPEIVGCLSNLHIADIDQEVKVVRVRDLNTRMIADDDIKARNGLLLVPKGQEITYPVLERLRNFAQRIGVVEPIRVVILHREAK